MSTPDKNDVDKLPQELADKLPEGEMYLVNRTESEEVVQFGQPFPGVKARSPTEIEDACAIEALQKTADALTHGIIQDDPDDEELLEHMLLISALSEPLNRAILESTLRETSGAPQQCPAICSAHRHRCQALPHDDCSFHDYPCLHPKKND